MLSMFGIIKSEAKKKGFFQKKSNPRYFVYILKIKTKLKYFSLHHEDWNETKVTVLERWRSKRNKSSCSLKDVDPNET